MTLATIMTKIMNEESFDTVDGILHHEEGVDVLPGNISLSVMELTMAAMVYQINRTEVSPEDRLSDEVQFFDTDTRVMENAEKRESRREMEKAEKSVAKSKKSIHDRLGEKKEKSAAGKAEKAAEKAVKKNKEQEL